MVQQPDVIVIGAGAAGLMCAAQAAKRGCRVWLLEHGKQAGRKILISGGGRCNFTNMHAEPAAYLSANPHFCKSALSRYSQWDFIALVAEYGIAYHEKTLGQLFCDDSARDITQMLLCECSRYGVTVKLRSPVLDVERNQNGFIVTTEGESISCSSVVVASGGLSMPKLGATPFGWQLAERFGLNVVPPRAALVPLTLHAELKQRFEPLAGISVPVRVQAENGQSFTEALLFTHRGLSGPAILQISSYWQPGQAITVDLLPEVDIRQHLLALRQSHAKQQLRTVLSALLPKRLVDVLPQLTLLLDKQLAQLSQVELALIAEQINGWQIYPNGTEGYRTAEVTLGGVDTAELSSKTMAAKKVPGLYFIGEVVDVTGWLGGYNFQWAWSSAWAAAQAVCVVL